MNHRADQVHFLRQIAPFDRLDAAELQTAADALDVEYFPSTHTLSEPGQSAEALWIVIKGRIDEYDDSGEVLATYGPDDLVGAAAVLRGTHYCRLSTAEETLCYTLPRNIFLRLGESCPSLHAHVGASLAERLLRLRRRSRAEELSGPLLARIRSQDVRPPMRIDSNCSIAEATTLLTRENTRAAIVNSNGRSGIVTLTDIARAVAAHGIDREQAIGTLARFELIGVELGDFVFNALLLMTRHRIGRVVVTHEGAVLGVIEQLDLLGMLSTQSFMLVARIEAADSVVALHEPAEGILEAVRALERQGAHPRHIARLVSELNLQLMRKLFGLLVPAELADQVCLIVMGSEGRGEQIFRTDQDNGLILCDGADERAARDFALRYAEALLQFGFPPCPGRVMLNNPQWCKPLRAWLSDIDQLALQQHPDALLQLSILSDASVVSGDASLLDSVRDHLSEALRGQPARLAHFARATLAFATPLGLFAHFVLARGPDGEGLDIKKGGIFPIVHGVRCLALEAGIRETNTWNRITSLARLQRFDAEFADDLGEALEVMSGFRLHRQLAQAKPGLDANVLNPRQLDSLERELLRDALRVVDTFKRFVSHHFKLHLLT
jgi:CBS domain-containing protein